MTKAELLKVAKPILFNTAMVGAILDGRKTVTRRVIKPQPMSRLCYCCMGYKHGTWGYPNKDTYKYFGDESYKLPDVFQMSESDKRWNPRYRSGDILYVRETWNYGYIEASDEYLSNETWFEELDPKKIDDTSYLYAISGYIYKTDLSDDECADIYMKWLPSIHMPKEAARIFLKVTNVRVERLQDITAEQCVAEGVEIEALKEVGEDFTKGMFQDIWDSTIKKADIDIYGWNANPWVWVYEFERIEVDE